ncbi:MAG: hypothetical protein ACREAC_29205, partial [Blastocatellia bacterium]
MQKPGSKTVAEIETRLLGCSLTDLKIKMYKAGLGRLWVVIETSFDDPSLVLENAARDTCISPGHM